MCLIISTKDMGLRRRLVSAAGISESAQIGRVVVCSKYDTYRAVVHVECVGPWKGNEGGKRSGTTNLLQRCSHSDMLCSIAVYLRRSTSVRFVCSITEFLKRYLGGMFTVCISSETTLYRSRTHVPLEYAFRNPETCLQELDHFLIEFSGRGDAKRESRKTKVEGIQSEREGK